MSFDDLPDAVLPEILSHVSPGALLRLSLVSKRFAKSCEVSFSAVCRKNRWVLPRKPRGEAAQQHHFPIRALYRRHACKGCGELGEFPVRSGHTAGTKQAPVVFLICKKCAKLPSVQSRLVDASLYVDLMSISGTKRLIEKGSRQRLTSKASRRSVRRIPPQLVAVSAW
ncbi:hypothetical protein ABBQ32_010385 [Trebouxia sp. C0010 RCD-2024]